MTAEQSMVQALTQAEIESVKATLLCCERVSPAETRRVVHAAPRSSKPSLKQPTFNWKVADKYNELFNFETEVGTFRISNNSIDENKKY